MRKLDGRNKVNRYCSTRDSPARISKQQLRLSSFNTAVNVLKKAGQFQNIT